MSWPKWVKNIWNSFVWASRAWKDSVTVLGKENATRTCWWRSGPMRLRWPKVSLLPIKTIFVPIIGSLCWSKRETGRAMFQSKGVERTRFPTTTIQRWVFQVTDTQQTNPENMNFGWWASSFLLFRKLFSRRTLSTERGRWTRGLHRSPTSRQWDSSWGSASLTSMDGRRINRLERWTVVKI